MRFTVLTLFPEQVEANIKLSITGRALAKGLFHFTALNIRDFADNPYGKVDDTIYGGGQGMLMQCAPIKASWEAAQELSTAKPRTLYMSPKGKTLTQAWARDLSKADHLIILCGHYEGVDARVLAEIDAEELSIGDYVLTGGELAASVLIDAVARFLPDVLPSEEVYEEESHSEGRLECRHFTKPAVWKGRAVPEILQSGHHKNIAKWRYCDGLTETLQKRPDMFDKLALDAMTHAALIKHIKDEAI